MRYCNRDKVVGPFSFYVSVCSMSFEPNLVVGLDEIKNNQ
jgi:hypothetical protein